MPGDVLSMEGLGASRISRSLRRAKRAATFPSHTQMFQRRHKPHLDSTRQPLCLPQPLQRPAKRFRQAPKSKILRRDAVTCLRVRFAQTPTGFFSTHSCELPRQPVDRSHKAKFLPRCSALADCDLSQTLPRILVLASTVVQCRRIGTLFRGSRCLGTEPRNSSRA